MPNSVSVVIPAYNAGKFIGNALASLEHQTRWPDEVVVVDDGSRDNTSRVVERYRTGSLLNIKLLRQDNKGPSASRNAAVRGAIGDLICFLDADDIVYPDFIRRTEFGLESNSEWVACFSDRDVVRIDGSLMARDLDHPGFRAIHKREVGERAFELDDDQLFSKMLPGSVIPMTILVRRSAFEGAGGFDEDIRMGEDLLLMLKLIKRGGKFGYIGESLGTWQRHDDNATSGHNAPAACMYADRIVTKLLDGKERLGLSTREIRDIERRQKDIGPKWIYAVSSNGFRETLPLGLRLLGQGRISASCFAKAIARWTAAVATRRNGRRG